MNTPAEWPVEIRVGSFTAKIYRKERSIRGQPYVAFRLSYYGADGRRVIRDFGQLADAKAAAREAAAAGQAGRTDLLTFTERERAEYLEAVGIAGQFGRGLLDLLTEYRDARRQLPPGADLREAAADYARRHPANAPKITVAEAVEQMLRAKEAAGLSEAYLRKLSSVLRRFASAFGMPLRAVRPDDVAAWLAGLRVGARTVANHHSGVLALYYYFATKQWVGRHLVEELAELPLPKIVSGEVGTFTADEVRRLLQAAPDDIRGTLAIGAFAGLRTEEIHRLEWQDVRLAVPDIIVGANKAKTGSRRVVPIAANLLEWLRPLAQTEGPVDPSPTSRAMTHRWRRIGEKVGVPWRHNALRHSCISYRLALTQDPAKVAFEAGNSPAMIHKHYKALMTEAQGREWFAVFPITT